MLDFVISYLIITIYKITIVQYVELLRAIAKLLHFATLKCWTSFIIVKKLLYLCFTLKHTRESEEKRLNNANKTV